MEELDSEVFGTSTGTPPPLATHCDVPLKYHKQRAALGIPSEGQYISRGNPCRHELDAIKHLSGITTFHHLDIAHAQYDLLNTLKIPSRPILVAEWKQQQRVSNELWKLNLDSLKNTSALPSLTTVRKFTPEEEGYLLDQYMLRCFWEEGVLSSGSEDFHPSHWWTKLRNGISTAHINEWKFYATNNLFAIAGPEFNFLASRDHLLILSDLSSQRYLLRLTSILEVNKARPDFLDLATLNGLLLNGDLILRRSGNLAYEYIYTLEPACTSRLVGDIPVKWEPEQTFKEVVCNETVSIAKKLDILDLHKKRDEILNNISESPILLSQTFGLYRLWGHPTLEPLEGTSALKSIATKVRALNGELADAITNKFKEEFIIRYIKHEHKWPILNVSLLSPNNPLRIAYQNKGPYPKHHKKYNRNCLTLVDFEQIFPVDPKFDLIEMIADKAMSLSTPELINKLTTGKGVGSAIDRSVLVQWLQSSLHDPEEFLKFIDKYGFTIAESSIGVKEKEREGKLKARLYGLMTLLKRMYIVLTEALLAEHILKYFPEITMVDDEISLDKKRLKFNSIKLMKRSLFTSLDFAKWNSNMREAETNGIFKVFDQLFGFKRCFQRTHEMFNTSFVYLLNGSYLPTFINGKFIPNLGSWFGHLGGIEGLRQKGWTLWTVTLILFASEDFPLMIYLMGQGDNQILREVYPESMSQERQLQIHRAFMEKLNFILSQIGPPLKMEETWTSRNFYIYGKYPIYNGAPLPLYAKKLCRMFRMCNEDFPTLESTVSSLTANLSSAVASSYDPGCLLIIYYYELIGTFQSFLRRTYLQSQTLISFLSNPHMVQIPFESRFRTIHVKASIKDIMIQPDIFYIKLSILPRCLGGFPVSNLFDIIIRGFPDEVSFSISTLKLFYLNGSPEIKTFISDILNPPLNPDANYTLLFEHPTCLNLDVPPTPSEARRNVIIRYLKTSQRVANPYLKTFLALLDSPLEKDLIQYLSTADPFMPRLLSMISGATVESRARHIANRLQKTKTISTLARTEGEEDLSSLITHSERNHTANILRFISGQYKGTNPWSSHHCSVDHAQKLRTTSWRKKIEGVDCVPPQEFMFIENPGPTITCSPFLECDKGFIAVRFDSGSLITSSPLSLGNHNPYRGSVTKQKMTGYGDKLFAQADPLLKKVFKAFDLIGWGVPRDGNLSLLLKQMLYSRTDLTPKYLLTENDQISGSVHHRLQDERTGHGGSVSILPNYSSRFCFDTFPLSEYSKGSKNVNLMFQSIMSYSTTLISWALSEGWTPACVALHIHVKSSCCIREINENLVECPTLPPVCFLMHKESPYLYKSADSYLPELMREQYILPNMESPQSGEDYLRRLIASVSQEILILINPTSWDLPDNIELGSRLVINWCLRLPLLQTLEMTCLRLAAYFLPALRSSTVSDYLHRLSEKVDRSPVVNWEKLGNLIFCPNFSHELVKEPYYAQISGDPCLSIGTLGINLKEVCKTILSTWSDNPDTRKQLLFLPMISSLYCGTQQHPSVLLMTREWIIHENFDPKIIRTCLINLIRKEVTTPMEESQAAENFLNQTNNSIFSESVDVLCKGAPVIEPLQQKTPSGIQEVPPTCDTLITFSSSQLRRSESKIFTPQYDSQKQYKTHFWRTLASPTTGNYKGLSILSYLFQQNQMSILSLGDGSGGYTWAALRLNEGSRVFYNSLITSLEYLEQAPPIPYIPSLAGWPSFENRIIQFDLSNNGITDITDPMFPDFLKAHLKSRFDGAICDAEISDRTNIDFKLNLASMLISLTDNLDLKWIILKGYASDTSVLRGQCSILLSRFNEVSVLRSSFSSHENTEVYLYARDPTANYHIARLGCHLQGYIIPDSLSILFSDLRDACELGEGKLTSLTIQRYNELINPDYDDVLHSRLLSSIPFYFNKSIPIYPHSVMYWIRSTCQLKPGVPLLYQKKLESHVFSNYLLARYSICWVFLSVWSGAVSYEDIPSIIDSCVLVWYYLQDGTWELSMCNSIPPRDLQGPSLLVWSLSSLLNSKHLKLLYRMLGIASVQIQTPIKYSNSINRGNLSAKGRTLPKEKMPVSDWVKTHIYFPAEVTQQSYAKVVTGSVKEIWDQRFSRRRRLYRLF